MTGHLRVLYKDGDGLPEWGKDDAKSIGRALSSALATSDHVVVISLQRDPTGYRIAKSFRVQRGARTSVYEIAGALHSFIAAVLEGDA